MYMYMYIPSVCADGGSCEAADDGTVDTFEAVGCWLPAGYTLGEKYIYVHMYSVKAQDYTEVIALVFVCSNKSVLELKWYL